MIHQPTPESDAVAYTVEQTHITIDKLRESWGWLLELVEPGRCSAGAARAITDDQAERLEALGHSDRAYRQHNLRHGMSALPPSPAAVRLPVVDAQVLVATLVLDAARTAATAAGSVYIGMRPSLAESVADALCWLEESALGEIRDERTAAKLDQLLQRADRTARSAAHCTDEEVESLGRPCPACGRRSLQRESSPGGAARVVRCVSKSCRCAGEATPDRPGCTCRKEHKREGKRHAWLPSELDGPYGLWAAIEALDRPRDRVRRAAAGHGGWQSRNMGGAL